MAFVVHNEGETPEQRFARILETPGQHPDDALDSTLTEIDYMLSRPKDALALGWVLEASIGDFKGDVVL